MVHNWNFRAGRILCGLLFLFLAPDVRAAHVDNDREMIDKALTHLASNERPQAQAIIVDLLKKDTKRPVRSTKELLRVLDQITHTFISEKAQQLFELALSFRRAEPSMEQQKLLEAQKLEPDNVAIQVALAQQMMEAKDCGSAAKSLAPLKDISMYLPDVSLALAQAYVCSSQFDQYLLIKSDLKPEDKTVLWDLPELEYDYKSGQFETGLILAQQTQKAAPNLPEAYYWDWRISTETKAPRLTSAQKYLELCRTLTPKSVRAFLAEPHLCSRTAEVEAFLKQQSGVNQGR